MVGEITSLINKIMVEKLKLLAVSMRVTMQGVRTRTQMQAQDFLLIPKLLQYLGITIVGVGVTCNSPATLGGKLGSSSIF